MSIMGGFDVIVGIGKNVIRNLVEYKLNMHYSGGSQILELPIHFNVQGVEGNAYFIINEVNIEANPVNDTISIILGFSSDTHKFCSSLMLEPPTSNNVATALNGNITIQQIPIVLKSTNIFQSQLSLVVKNSTASLNFTTESQMKIEGIISNTPASFQNLRAAIASESVKVLDIKNIDLTLPLNFFTIENDTQNGTLNPLIFQRIEAHCYKNDELVPEYGDGSPVSPEGINVYGMIFANKPNGDPNNKTFSFPENSYIQFCIPNEYFQNSIFCPAVAAGWGASISDLPTSCGSGEELLIPVNGPLINEIFLKSFDWVRQDIPYDDVNWFDIGDLGFYGTFEIWDDDYDFSGVISNLPGDATFVNIDMNPWPSFGYIPPSYADEKALEAAFSPIIPGINGALNVAYLPPANPIGRVYFYKDAITMLHYLEFPDSPSIDKSLKLEGSVVTRAPPTVSATGIYHFKGLFSLLNLCLAKDFPYTEYLYYRHAIFEAIPTLLGKPLQILWSVRSGSNEKFLNDPSGTITIPVTVHDPFPLNGGHDIYNVDVEIGYFISPDQMKVELTNKPEDGNYSIELKAKATDPVQNVLETEYYNIDFFGHLAEIGGGYQEYVQNCAQNIGNTIWRPTKQRGPPHFPLDPDPPPEVLVDLINILLTSKVPQVGSIIKEMRNMYGKSYYKAINLMSGIRKMTSITRVLKDRIESQTKNNEEIK